VADNDSHTILLKWSDHIPISDVQDPLGLGLRGAARLASQLLYCITSITPRARYFSFIPWCIQSQRSSTGTAALKLSMRDAIVLRERALVLACLQRHDGRPCSGGGIVGSRDATKWLEKGAPIASLRRLSFTKNPALDAYFNSLLNLGFFVTDGNQPEIADEALVEGDEDDVEIDFDFDSIELSPLGEQVARSYGEALNRLTCTKELHNSSPEITTKSLTEFGKRGCLCGVASEVARDREILRKVFLDEDERSGESHRFRRESLLLIMELCRQVSADGWMLNPRAFCLAVFYGKIVDDDASAGIALPELLRHISERWRMYYFHHFMSVALEGMFSWLTIRLSGDGQTGKSLTDLLEELDTGAVSDSLSELLAVALPPRFGQTPVIETLRVLGCMGEEFNDDFSESLDKVITSAHPASEIRLEDSVRDPDRVHSAAGLAVSALLLVVTLARFRRWERTAYGRWLANAVEDPSMDLLPPVVELGLRSHFGRWWDCTWRDLIQYVLSRYVVHQHQWLSYERTAAGDRCLLQIDGDLISASAAYEGISLGNPRLLSAVQILRDLGLISDDGGPLAPTADGQRVLKQAGVIQT
jgi:hypothetical protein